MMKMQQCERKQEHVVKVYTCAKNKEMDVHCTISTMDYT